MVHEKICVQKTFGSWKHLGPKKIGVSKIWGPKKFGVPKNLGSQKNWFPNKFGVKNKNETYYRSERNIILTISICFNYLNLFLTIWIYFYPFLSIGIYSNRFEYISIYLNLFIVPLVLSIWGKHMKNIRPAEIILTNIRPILVKYQTNIIQASD